MQQHKMNKTPSIAKSFTGMRDMKLNFEKLKSKMESHYNKLEFELEFTKDTSMAGLNIKSDLRSEPTKDLMEEFWIKFVMFGGRINSEHIEMFGTINNKKAGLLQYYWAEDAQKDRIENKINTSHF